jgi:hypothetical protein
MLLRLVMLRPWCCHCHCHRDGLPKAVAECEASSISLLPRAIPVSSVCINKDGIISRCDEHARGRVKSEC